MPRERLAAPRTSRPPWFNSTESAVPRADLLEERSEGARNQQSVLSTLFAGEHLTQRCPFQVLDWDR